eukprot:GILK01008081.1.p1 GENE.GILK01008081.1~~GILK01008081.1.p1  ORF type:complete len:373 (+),score=75.64 GILK01008081.1:37-1119(+)
MEALKAELERKKQEKAALNAKHQQEGKKWVRRADLEKERERQYLEEQQKRDEERRRKLEEQLQEKSKPTYRPEKPAQKIGNNTDATSNGDASGSSDQAAAEAVVPMSKSEIIRRLRKLGLPATFFGESDMARYHRLRDAELNTDDLQLKMQQNVFQEELKQEAEKIRLAAAGSLDDGEHEVNKEQGDHESDEEDKDLSSRLAGTPEEKVLLWCKKMLREWEEELQQRPEEVKRTAEGGFVTGQYRQTKRYLRPLFKSLKRRSLPADISHALDLIVSCCMERQYVQAHDTYLRLAIGNAPWPMGVTMVGIHERSGRSKIFSSQIAHILNDETQRKYIQSIKRLMTFSQRQYPTDPSRSVLN